MEQSSLLIRSLAARPGVSLGWLFAIAATVFAYWPGLAGPFVFDDFGNIDALGRMGGVTDWESFRAFVLGGHGGPTGRPVAMLTFLLDGNNWPTDPWPFKRTNLFIHLINGVLLGALTRQILRALDYPARDAAWISLLAAAVWLLHPFLVSTTLYAVQRMAQLATLFIFAGLLVFVRARRRVADNPSRAYWTMSIALPVFTLLSMLSKENGILLPMLAGVIEFTVFRAHGEALHRYWTALFIGVPSLVVLAYLAHSTADGRFFDAVEPRNFSRWERLLTEQRILVDYLRHWFVPDLYTAGVFQDHVQKSAGLLTPVTTLLSLLFHLALATLAILWRRRAPLFALAVLFYYASHVLESTVVNLELYFEHRNYVAAAFLAVPLIALALRHLEARLFIVAGVVICGILAGFTRYSATIWQDYPSMVVAAAKKAPDSARAQSQFALNLYNEGRHEEAIAVLDATRQRIPDDLAIDVIRTTVLCNSGALTPGQFAEFSGRMARRLFDPRTVNTLTTMMEGILSQRCPAVSAADTAAMFLAMAQLPGNTDPRAARYSQLQYFIGLSTLNTGDVRLAVDAFARSLKSRPGAGHAMLMAAHLATHGRYDEALYFSDLALRHFDKVAGGFLPAERVRREDILAFQQQVRADRDAVPDEGSNAPGR
jgi:tetratricopeptide (TPR) repeat protein